MANEILPFMREVVERCMVFASGITHIHIRPNAEGHVEANAPAVDRSVVFKATSEEPLPLHAPACLGNIQYLNHLLKSDLLGRNPKIEINTDTVGNREKPVVTSIRFQAKGRLDVLYLATDPFRGVITQASSAVIEDWPVTFLVNPAMIREVQELRRIHGSAPSAGKEDIMEMTFDGSQISVGFGQYSHTSSLTLDTEVESDNTKPMKIKFLSDQFVKVLQQIEDDGEIIAQFSPKAVCFHTNTERGKHEAVMIGRTVREDDE